ncbi:hypothetical protein HYV10_01860 [Candidatus Dependentiae bacterium]|nr:hypothetical protein [Candidatus Dependentiae bacterium]
MIKNRYIYFYILFPFFLTGSDRQNDLEVDHENDLRGVYNAIRSFLTKPFLNGDSGNFDRNSLISTTRPTSSVIGRVIITNEQSDICDPVEKKVKQNNICANSIDFSRVIVYARASNLSVLKIPSRPTSARKKMKEIPHYMASTQSFEKKKELNRCAREVKNKKEERSLFLFNQSEVKTREVGGVREIFR